MSGTRWVLLDDTDPSITYTGSWFERSDGFNMGNWGAPYGGSQHGINGTGSLSFPFTGTRVRVLGTSAVRNSSGVIDPTWTCIVGVSEIKPSAPWTASINNWPLCESPTYTPGQYTLTLNTVSTENTNLWFDQVRYLPLANMSSSLTGATVIVEHNDPTVQYASGNWQPLTNSAMMTLQTGAVMTVKFTGTKLSWVGWTPSGYPTGNSEASYSIDSEPATTFQIRGLPSGSAALYNQHLFETPQLPAGEHTLTVTHQGPSAPLTLDHLLVQNGDIILPAGAGSQGSSIDGPDATSAATGTAQNADPNPSQTGQAQPSTGPPVGTIVGGAIGGAAFVLFCVLGLIWCLRRRKRDRITRVNLSSPGAAMIPAPFSQVTPFQYSSVGGAIGNQSTYSMSGSQTNLTSAYPNPAGWTASTPGAYQDVPSPFNSRPVHRDQKIRPNRGHDIELSPFNSSNALSDTSSSSGPLSSYRSSSAHLVHHKDSGIRLTSTDPLPAPEIIDVPPSYTPS